MHISYVPLIINCFDSLPVVTRFATLKFQNLPLVIFHFQFSLPTPQQINKNRHLQISASKISSFKKPKPKIKTKNKKHPPHSTAEISQKKFVTLLPLSLSLLPPFQNFKHIPTTLISNQQCLCLYTSPHFPP